MLRTLKTVVKKTPVLGRVVELARTRLNRSRNPLEQEPFPGSLGYWEKRYAAGGNSGAGSYSRFAEFKAEILNGFVARHGVRSVIEFGCGDGNQLKLAAYPDYVGFDVSATAVQGCRTLFASDSHKAFRLIGDYACETADLALPRCHLPPRR